MGSTRSLLAPRQNSSDATHAPTAPIRSVVAGAIAEQSRDWFEAERAFDPETVNALAAAFDAAWEAVLSSGAPFAEQRYHDIARDIIAKQIIAMAHLGERDHRKLVDGGLLALAKSNLKPRSTG